MPNTEIACFKRIVCSPSAERSGLNDNGSPL
jgi:hypothetical protein